MKDNIAIKLTGISKKYLIHHEKPTLMERVFSGKNEEFWALRNINLEIKKGDRLGIIGPNGCGKTTILKIIAGITTPSTGRTENRGKVVSLIDLEAGFHPDLSGIQNIYLNGMIIGMRKDEIDFKLGKIIEFADIGKFIDAPLFTYSEGMKLRLGFSVIINADPETLLLDENLSVGDEEFRKKSFNEIQKLLKSGKTIVLVSHIPEIIMSYCAKVLWLEKGKIKAIGNPKKILNDYIKYKK